MKAIVTKVSEITKNNNVILTLVCEGTMVKTPFGNKTPKFTYLMAVEAGSNPDVGYEDNLDMSLYNVRESCNTVEGKVLSSNWLSLKGE